MHPRYLIGLLCLLGSALQAQPFNAEERAELTKYLNESAAEVRAAVTGLSPEQLNWKPAADRWSVAQTLEHIVVTEQGLYQNIVQRMMAAPVSSDSLKAARAEMPAEQMTSNIVADRANKRQAPEMFQPTGRFADVDAALAAFAQNRNAMQAFVANSQDDVHGRLYAGPAGPLDVPQWLTFITAHTRRHLAQIAEIKADPAFPGAQMQMMQGPPLQAKPSGKTKPAKDKPAKQKAKDKSKATGGGNP